MSKSKTYSQKEIEFIVTQKNLGLSWEGIVKAFSDRFKREVTFESMRKCLLRHGECAMSESDSGTVSKLESKICERVLVISDLHAPYYHPDTVAFLTAVKKKFSPTDVISIGDEADFHASSYHESSTELDGPGKELDNAIEALKPIYKLFPNCTVIESNHGSMVYRKAQTGGIPLKAIKAYNDILDAPTGWKWVFDLKIKTALGPVYLCHGKTSTAGKLAKSYGMSVVQGHYHSIAQITYISTPEHLLFDAHTGSLCDDKSLAFAYNKINPKRPIVSILVILQGIPQLVPMVLNSDGRWIGSL